MSGLYQAFSVVVEGLGEPEVVVKIQGEADLATAGILAARLGEVTGGVTERLVVDLAEVSFMDCAGVLVIAQARQGLPQGCQMILCRPCPIVRKVLALSGLDVMCAVEDGQANDGKWRLVGKEDGEWRLVPQLRLMTTKSEPTPEAQRSSLPSG